MINIRLIRLILNLCLAFCVCQDLAGHTHTHTHPTNSKRHFLLPPNPYPLCSASFTKPLRFFRVTEFMPGAQSRDSAAPPTTITTALPVPLCDRRWSIELRFTGQIPEKSIININYSFHTFCKSWQSCQAKKAIGFQKASRGLYRKNQVSYAKRRSMGKQTKFQQLQHNIDFSTCSVKVVAENKAQGSINYKTLFMDHARNIQDRL